MFPSHNSLDRVLSSKAQQWRSGYLSSRLDFHVFIVVNALANVGLEALMEDLQKHGEVNISCHYCLKNYVFNEQDIKSLFN